jgi:hypothetical protein
MFTFLHTSESWRACQQWQLSHIAEFSAEIRRLANERNVVTGLLCWPARVCWPVTKFRPCLVAYKSVGVKAFTGSPPAKANAGLDQFASTLHSMAHTTSVNSTEGPLLERPGLGGMYDCQCKSAHQVSDSHS